MPPPAVRVDRLSKAFTLGQKHLGYHNLTESIRQTLGTVARKLTGVFRSGAETPANPYWALRDINFEVAQGEVMGVIGRNGAGKSTLLKILSRVTIPTTGRVELRGRMGSMLEVNAGFHPELTGRENVFLAGSILGMRRREIQGKFDQIVEFSEIGPHLDTQVKRYSSGQYVRLAFAVSAYLEPEILIVDEVLAVGDATFQRRCIDRMADLARDGRTILFVTHNMQLIPRLCRRAVLLEKGQMVGIGPSAEMTNRYMERLLAETRVGDLRDKHHTGNGRAQFVRASVTDAAGRPLSVFVSGDDLVVRVEVEAKTDLPEVNLQVVLASLHGHSTISGWSKEDGFSVALSPGSHGFECRFRSVNIRPGHTFLVHLSMGSGNGGLIDAVENAVVMDTVSDDRSAHLSTSQDHGMVYCEHSWKRV